VLVDIADQDQVDDAGVFAFGIVIAQYRIFQVT
jgi:hypothetical protein